jgi:hypothetical protein
MVPPRVHKQREEYLVYNFLAKSGKEVGCGMPFKTLGGEPPKREVEVGQPTELDVRSWTPFDPIKRAWGLVKNTLLELRFFKTAMR